jgi:4-coumarate--CoA ligase
MQVATAATANAGIPREHVFPLEGKAEGFATIQELMDIGKSYAQHC